MVDYLDPGTGQGPGIPTPTPRLGASLWSGFGEVSPGTYAGVTGTALSFIGQILAASQAKKAAAYNADVANRNAQAAADAAEIEAQQHERQAAIATQDILLARQAQQWKEDQQRAQQQYVAGQTQAILGASGLLMRGSPLAAADYTLQQQEKTILAGRYQAHLQERALEDERVMQGYAADVSRYGGAERLRVGKAAGAMALYQGGQQAFASTIGAVGTLASGAARTYAQLERAKARQKGVTLLDGGYE